MDILRTLYAPFHQYMEGNEMFICVVGPFLVLNITFWFISLCLLYLDATTTPKWLHKYKIQPDKNAPVSSEQMKDAIRVAVYNVIVLTPFILIGMYVIQKRIGMPFLCGVEDTPSLPRALLDIVLSALAAEVYFYYSHRLIHHPMLYQTIHKKHHTWTAPIGMAAVYATPTEYLLSNIMTGLVGPLFLRSHITTVLVWCSIIMVATTFRHSGYHFPFLTSPQMHDYHHLTFNYNFGSNGLMDWLHGTDAQFKHSIQKTRHRYHHWPGRSMQELFPEEKGHMTKDGAKQG